MKDDPQNNIRVIPPLLRKEVTLHEPYSGDYIHGYMVNAGFSENVMKWHRQHPRIPLRFFWDKWEEEPVKRVDNTLSFYQLDDVEFLRQMAGCKAYASTAGFESVCEAMYLGKPILMVPAHIEQDCNAYDAEKRRCGISFPPIFKFRNSCWNLRRITIPIVILCIGYVELSILC